MAALLDRRRVGQNRVVRLIPVLFLMLSIFVAPPALAAEPAVAVRPSDTATIQLCFRLASIRFMEEQVHKRLDEEDVAAGRMNPSEVEPYSENGLVTIAPSLRALFLGWERALVEDRRARNLTDEQIAAESEALARDFKTVLAREMRGDYFHEKERCEELLIPLEIAGGVTAKMTEALDPADFGTAGFRPDGPVIDEANLTLCFGQAEMARLVVGAGALDS